MTPGKLTANLEALRSRIVRKPATRTDQYAKTVEEAFSYYTRTRSINFILSLAEVWAEDGWPFPTYMPLDESSWKIQVASNLTILFPIPKMGRLKRIFLLARKSWRRNDSLVLSATDEGMLNLFTAYQGAIFSNWSEHVLFEGRRTIVSEIIDSFHRGSWACVISTAFPLVDHLVRSAFGTKRIDKDVNEILGVFRAAGLMTSIKPGHKAWDKAREADESDIDGATDRDLRLPGIVLGSFLDFAEVYYGYYRAASGVTTNLNRHAVIHCAAEDWWTEVNATKLLTFLDLTLTIHPILKILLKEE